MSNQIRNNFIYLITYFLITLLMCSLVELFFFELEAVKNFRVSQISFDSIWILIMLVILYFLVKKIGINPGFFATLCIILGPILYIIGLVLTLWANRFDFEIIEKKYVGTKGVEEDNENETYYHYSYVFHKNDKRVEKELTKLDEEYMESSQNKFIFWQTAVAAGFDPKYIKNYNCCENLSQRLELYLTIGPFMIIENLLNALNKAFLLLSIPIIGFCFKKRLFFNDISDFKKLKFKTE